MKKLIAVLAAALLLLSLCACKKECTHDWVLDINRDADCVSDGYQEFHCSLCGETYHLDTGRATGHKPLNAQFTTVSDPTCTKAGSKTNVCSVCGQTYSVSIPKLGHDYKNGKCTRCGAKEDSGARHTDSEAFAVAQDIVESELKSPSTAKFCKLSEATITHDGDQYTVKGWVDAQNSFGATVRSKFTVTYTATTKGYKNGSVTFS